jgi:hypothetical protein
MQLTLVFPESPSPAQQNLSGRLGDAEARAELLKILARIIARALEATEQAEAADE